MCTRRPSGYRFTGTRDVKFWMGKLNDVTIRGWIRSGERFEGRSDGVGLVLAWRKYTGSLLWKFRYRFAGEPRVMNLGLRPTEDH